MIKYLVIAASLIFTGDSFAQYDGLMNEIYFMRQPSPRFESMGRGAVAVDGNQYYSFYNPALLGTVRNAELMVSYTDPGFWGAQKARYNFEGITYPFSNKIGFGLSRYYLDYGFKNEATDINGNTIYKENQNVYEAIYSLTGSYQLSNNLYFGANVNYSRIYFSKKSNGSSFPIDLGIAKFLNLYSSDRFSHMLALGISVSNILTSKITLPQLYIIDVDSILMKDNSIALPTIVRTGISYSVLWNEHAFLQLNNAQLLLHGEYEEVTNSKYYGGIHLGSEITILEILIARLGYFKERRFFSPPKFDTGYTYGIGLNIPLYKLTDNKVPFAVTIDYVKLPWGYKDQLTFKSWSFSIQWKGK